MMPLIYTVNYDDDTLLQEEFTFDVCYWEEKNINEAEEPALNAGELTEVNHVSVLGGPDIFIFCLKAMPKAVWGI